MKITAIMVSAAPLLAAVATCEREALEATNVKLAELSGRSDKNIPRDLTSLIEAGWVSRETGSRPLLTDAGRDVLAAVDRANNPDAPAAEIPLHLVDEDPDLNPRKSMTKEDWDALAELGESIVDKGVLQPILVRPSETPGRFKVVAGWRRWKASVDTGRFTIPALVKDLDDAQAHEAATIENEQREDMNPIDRARAYQRIIRDRMAKNPELSLKAAKEIVADAIKKSSRSIELSLQLLTLPAIKQVEISQGVTTPRDAITWARNQPKLSKLPDDVWLLALEVLDKTIREPLPKEYEWRPVETVAGYAMAEDDRVRETSGFFNVSYSVWRGGEAFPERSIGLTSHTGRTQLGLRFPDVDLDDEAQRAAAMAALRADLGVEPAEGARYATPWLADLEWPADALAALEAENAQRRQQNAAQAKADADRIAAQAAAKAKSAADMGAPGKAFLAAVRQLEADWRRGEFAADPTSGFQRRFAEIWAQVEVEGPWTVAGPDAEGDGKIVDRAGVENRGAGPALEARRRLIAIALNFAAGLAPFSGEPFPTPWADGELGDAWAAAHPSTQPAPPPVETEDDQGEDDDQLEDDDDAEFGGCPECGEERCECEPELSPAVLRLAGAGPAEARP